MPNMANWINFFIVGGELWWNKLSWRLVRLNLFCEWCGCNLVQGLIDHVLGNASFGVLLSIIQLFIEPLFSIVLLLTSFCPILVLRRLAPPTTPIFFPFDTAPNTRGVTPS